MSLIDKLEALDEEDFVESLKIKPVKKDWSFSRHGNMESCKRQYFYSYRVWNSLINELKGMEVAAFVSGSAVHDEIARSIRDYYDGIIVNPEDYEIAALDTFLRIRDAPNVQLDMDVYDTRFLWYAYYPERIRQYVRNAFNLPIYSRIIRAGEKNLVALEPSFEHFYTDQGIKVYAIPDVMFRENGKLIIVDWKTGNLYPDKVRIQGSIYAYYALEKHGVPYDQAEIILGGAKTEEELVIEPIPLEEVYDLIHNSWENMKGMSTLEDFPKTDDLENCKYCTFRRICGR